MIVGWLAQLWAWLRAVWQWLVSHPIALAGAIGAVFGAMMMVRSKRNQIGRLADALEVQKIKASVARDEARAEVLAQQADVHAQEVEELRAEIVTSKRRAVELAHAKSLDGASDAEIAKLFSDAGL